MTTIQPNFFAVLPHRQAIVGCHNQSSAVAYATGRLPNKTEGDTETRVAVHAFRSPSGQFYVKHGNQRLDCANQATARYYLHNGVPLSVMLSASLSSLRA